MRFKLEKESVQGNTCNSKHVANVKIDSETTFSLPTTFYAFSHDKRSPLLYSFIIYETHHDIVKFLSVFVSQGIQLELEKVGNDYKLALVDGLGNPYYHYYHETHGNDIIHSIATINSIPENKILGEYVQIYDYEGCGVSLKLLSGSRVLIDPKDIISSEDISSILTNTKLIIKAEGIFQIKDSFTSYLSANVYDFTGEKVGILNNVGCHFDRGGNLFHLSPYEHLNHGYFATKKLGNNYVGCISNEKGECREFYGLNPSSFGYEHDSSPDPYPYYYNLENFNVDLVNLKEFEDLKAEVKKLKRASICSPSGPKGEPGVDGQEGNIGPQGVAGVPGPKGDQGIQGFKGDKGNIGLPGPVGSQGEKGDVGPQGLKGIQGLKGDISEKGDIGAPGTDGLKGDIGPRGPQGNKGNQGLVGPVGSKGDQGSQGDRGPKGEKGDIGTPGLKGNTGNQGVAGAPGTNGLKGAVGKDGLPGLQGPQGADGAQGTDGLKGDMGPMGFNGTQGPPGAQGQKGERGYSGFKGNIGPSGLEGQSGAKGDKGNSGSQGSKGETGPKGDAGPQGVDGVPGLIGIPGSKGDMGKKGEIGLPGIHGLQGHKGDIGSQGLQGEKGNQGVAGPKGERGNNGTDANPEEVAQKLINNGTIVNQVLEYRDQDGDLVLEQQIAGKLIYDQNIHAGIATELIDNKAQELTDALLSDANDTLVAKLANSTELTQSISEGLRQNPGETKGAQGVAGLPGIPGPKGDTGPIGTQGNKGEPGIDGTKGNQGNIGPKGIDGVPGLMGIKGDMGEKGDTGAPGIDGLQGHKGDIGSQGLQGEKGNQGVAGLPGIPGPKGESGIQGFPGAKGEPGIDGLSGPIGPKGADGVDGLPGIKGDQGVRGLKGIDGASGSKGEKGNTGPVGSKGADGLPGMPGPVGLKGGKGDIGLQGPKGQAGRSGSIGMPGLKGEDGIGADVASQFLRTINQTKLEIQDAQKTAEIAKTASEKSAKEALYAEDKVTKLHDKIANLTKRAETFKNQAVQSQRSTEALRQDTREFHSKTKDIFCKTKPTDQVCTVRRKKRETPPVTSGASRPIPFISQVMNFFYLSVEQDEYKLKNKIQELDQVAKIIDAADVVTKFERVLEETASKCSIPKKSLNFNPVKLQSTIINKSLFNDGNRNELLKFLCVAAKKSFSHYKQIDKCLATFKDHMEETLKTNEQQRDFVNTEKIVADSEQPRSFMSDVTPPSTFNAINQEVFGYLR